MAYRLEALTCCDDEFHEVIRMCGIPYSPDDVVPLLIEKIVNPRLSEAFDRRVAMITSKTGTVPLVRWPMFHGTSDAAAASIVSTGFKSSKSSRAAFNYGTYFATDPNYSIGGFAKSDEYGHQFLLVCRVIQGRSCLGTSNGTTDTSRFDSATSDHEGTFVITPYDDGALPVYFIRYFKQFPRLRLP